MARDRPTTPAASAPVPAPVADAVGGFASAVVERLVVRRSDAADAVRDAADRAVDTARGNFHAALAEPSPFSALVSSAFLTPDEAEVVGVAVAAETSEALQRLIVHLTGDRERNRLELGLLHDLFDPPHRRTLAVGDGSGPARAALIGVRAAGPWSRHVVEVAPSVVGALLGERAPDPALPYGCRLIEAPHRAAGVDLVVVSGPDAVRRRQAAQRHARGGRLLVVPLPADAPAWAAVVREATLLGATVCLEVDAAIPDVGRRWIDRTTHLTWIVSSPRPLTVDQLPRRVAMEIDAPATEPTDDEWAAALGPDTPRTHRLTATQLEQVVPRFDANGRDLDLAVRRLVSSRLDDLTRRVEPSRTWRELVLAPDQIELLGTMVDRYAHGATVFDHWGFTASPSRGLVMLFSGPSGTGKTLAAEVIAGRLGLDMYRLDLSSVVSKYIGETEKNLDEVFTAAGAGNLVLFFDEADALFGKRSDVRDAHDRYANLEVSYLLQRLERYDGVVIMATNFEKNIDEAFMRRIHARIDFALPSAEQRLLIWQQHIPSAAPLAGDVDLEALAARFELTGGAIRNAAVGAAFAAASRGTDIGMPELVDAVARELRKQGRLVRRDDFPELHRA